LPKKPKKKKKSAAQVIFAQGDAPTGLYIIADGMVDIIKQDKMIATLTPPQFFGELALLDNAVRSASAVAKTDICLLYIDKEAFERITDDAPEVLRSVVQIILGYLRGYL
jgi:CRP/FNR family cyclic AMP-dependent transcriptional regulator